MVEVESVTVGAPVGPSWDVSGLAAGPRGAADNYSSSSDSSTILATSSAPGKPGKPGKRASLDNVETKRQPRIGVVCKDLWVKYHKGKNELLRNINMAAKPGELFCVMGPSGSGKTTLLNAICRRIPSRKVEGEVFFNGEKSTKDNCRTFCSYVMAKDYLLPYLTVKETLSLNARVRQPNMDIEKRKQLVLDVARSLELVDVLPCYVGGAWRKGLSTGQMKRLAIAIELLSNPSVFLLDEPSTGLDSKLAFQLVSILRQVALKGKTVIVTLHQPSHMAFALFDRVLLLSKGREYYHGSPSNVLTYFAARGHICPPNFNPADFIVEVVTDEFAAAGSSASGSGSRSNSSVSSAMQLEGLDNIAAANHRLLRDKQEGPYYSTSEHLAELAMAFEESPECAALPPEQMAILDSDPQECQDMKQARADQGQAGWREQYRMVWRRTALNSVRNPMVGALIVMINVVQALLLGAIFWQLTSDMPSVTSTPISSLIVWTDQFTYWMAYGLDMAGLDPLAQAVDYGVDGYNRSVVFDVLTSPNILDWVNQVITCTHTEAGLDSIYPQNDWLQTSPAPSNRRLQPNNVANLEASIINPVAAIWAKYNLPAEARKLAAQSTGVGSSNSPWPMVSLGSDQLTTDLMSLLQLADHYLLKTVYPEITGTDPLSYWLQVFVKMGPYVDPLLYCLSLDTWETSFSTLGPRPVTPGALQRHDGNYNPYNPANSGAANSGVDVDAFAFASVDPRTAADRARRALRGLITAATGVAPAAFAPLPEGPVGPASKLAAFLTQPASSLGRQSHQFGGASPAGGTGPTVPTSLSVPIQGRHHVGGEWKAPKRQLGSGLSGLVTALIDNILKSPDSPFYGIYEASVSVGGILGSCNNAVCDGINSSLDTISKYFTDTMTTFMTVINIAGLTFFMAATVGFASYDVLLHFPAEKPLFNRDNANGLYGGSAYFMAKISCDIIFQTIPILCWCFIMYWMIGFPADAGVFFTYLAIIFCTSFAAYGFGYAISSLSPRVEFGIIVAPLLLVVMLCLAGFFIRDSLMPSWIAWFRFFSIYRWSFFSILLDLFHPGDSYGTLPNEIVLLVCGVTDTRLWFCVMMLVVLGLGFRLCGYLGLVFTNRRIGLQG